MCGHRVFPSQSGSGPTAMVTDQRNPFVGKRIKNAFPRKEGSGVGLLLLGPTIKPLYANPEALQILVYPETEIMMAPDRLIDQKIRSVLLVDGTCSESGFVPHFSSGRRRYLCRAFSLNPQPAKSLDGPVLALLFERRSHIDFEASQMAARFHLTPREKQILKYVMQGLTNKEIGTQMNISPNTVKAFLRMIMTKVGVSTRSGIVGMAIAAT